MAEESFEVLEGSSEMLVHGTWSAVGTGETAIVPINEPHSLRNLSDAPAKIVNTHRPAQRMEDFFADGATLIAGGKIKRLPTKDPGSAIYAAMLFTKYPDELRHHPAAPALPRRQGRRARLRLQGVAPAGGPTVFVALGLVTALVDAGPHLVPT